MGHRNIHQVERLLRFILGESIALYSFFHLGASDWRYAAYAAATLLCVSALTGVDYLYYVFEISTRERFMEHESKLLEGILIYLIVIVGLVPLYQTGELGEVSRDLLIATFVGFLAQLIDGSLGMGGGVTSNSFLIGLGIPPVVSSASIHVAKFFTSGASGFAHLRAGNVDGQVLRYLIPSGILGALLGAYALASIPGHFIAPFIALYLFIMGLLIIEKAHERKPLIIKGFLWIKNRIQLEQAEVGSPKLTPFGVLGGTLDAIGGGGWGPLLTLTLFFKGENLRKAIGSVNLSEFFVTLATAVALITAVRLEYWQTILGLIVGGLLAVPLGPIITKKVPYKPLMLIVGSMVLILSLRMLTSFFLAYL